jgi:hypothetical protein
LAARDQEFTIANVIRVTAGVEIRDFPPFPRGGLLVVLDPPCLVADHELKGCAAEVTPESGPARKLHFEFWHMNDHRVIGLLSERSEVADFPLRAKVRFVKRPPGR